MLPTIPSGYIFLMGTLYIKPHDMHLEDGEWRYVPTDWVGTVRPQSMIIRRETDAR